MKPIKWVALSLVIAVLGAVLGVVVVQNVLQGVNDLGPLSTQEALSIRAVEFIADNSANVTVHNSGHEDTRIMSASVNGIPAILEPSKQPNAILHREASAVFRITLPNQTHFSTGEIYQFRILTQRGKQVFINATYTV